MRNVVLGASLVALLLVVLGFLGHLARSFDTISMGRPLFALLCGVGVFAAKPRWLKLSFAVVVAGVFFNLANLFLSQEPGGDIRVYSKNLWFANSEIPALVADIEAARVDVVMLQEVSDRNNTVLERLKTSHPYQHLCRFSAWSGVALASRHPFVGEPICSNSRAVAAAPIQLKTEKIWVVSAHIPWPWPHDSRANEAAAERVLSDLDGAVIIAGDFNTMPWSERVQHFASITQTQLAGPIRATFDLKKVPLPLDFALAPHGGSVEIRPRLGSDHAGILADLRLWPR
ncbi:MAG: endonuclease/exonuclease/phosphatase family protein [Aliishimia sp.]